MEEDCEEDQQRILESELERPQNKKKKKWEKYQIRSHKPGGENMDAKGDGGA